MAQGALEAIYTIGWASMAFYSYTEATSNVIREVEIMHPLHVENCT